MTINYWPACTCHLPYWQKGTAPCSVHGYNGSYVWTTTATTYRVCHGRHCAHDVECNRVVTRNGA